MKIGQLAKVTDTKVETIRFYEREGLLLAPSRSNGNYRVYENAHVERLSFIRHCRSLDIALDEIRRLLQFKEAPADNCHEVNEVLDEHIGHVAERIRELRRLERQLRDLRELCTKARDAAHCGILVQLSQGARRSPALAKTAVVNHMAGSHRRGGRAQPRPSVTSPRRRSVRAR